jgi:hypothetical protein
MNIRVRVGNMVKYATCYFFYLSVKLGHSWFHWARIYVRRFCRLVHFYCIMDLTGYMVSFFLVGYLTTLSVSRLCSIDDRMIIDMVQFVE